MVKLNVTEFPNVISVHLSSVLIIESGSHVSISYVSPHIHENICWLKYQYISPSLLINTLSVSYELSYVNVPEQSLSSVVTSISSHSLFHDGQLPSIASTAGYI